MEERSFSRTAGRDAFKEKTPTPTPPTSSSSRAELWMRQEPTTARAMRSFTQSVEVDDDHDDDDDGGGDDGDRRRAMRAAILAQRQANNRSGAAPAASIEDTRMVRESGTTDTVVDLYRDGRQAPATALDCTLGETQKYKMAVPGPGHSEQEQELHFSLLKRDASDDDSISLGSQGTAAAAAAATARPSTLGGDCSDSLTLELRQAAYEAALAVQRPRATTPTSWATIEQFVAEEEMRTTATTNGAAGGGPQTGGGGGESQQQAAWNERRAKRANRPPPDAGARTLMRVQLPQSQPVNCGAQTRTALERRSSKPWAEFYGSMGSSGQVETADLLSDNPVLRDRAPPAPVVHRRQSTEWCNFDRDEEPVLPPPPPMNDKTKEETSAAEAAAAAAAAAATSTWSPSPPPPATGEGGGGGPSSSSVDSGTPPPTFSEDMRRVTEEAALEQEAAEDKAAAAAARSIKLPEDGGRSTALVEPHFADDDDNNDDDVDGTTTQPPSKPSRDFTARVDSLQTTDEVEPQENTVEDEGAAEEQYPGYYDEDGNYHYFDEQQPSAEQPPPETEQPPQQQQEEYQGYYDEKGEYWMWDAELGQYTATGYYWTAAESGEGGGGGEQQQQAAAAEEEKQQEEVDTNNYPGYYDENGAYVFYDAAAQEAYVAQQQAGEQHQDVQEYPGYRWDDVTQQWIAEEQQEECAPSPPHPPQDEPDSVVAPPSPPPPPTSAGTTGVRPLFATPLLPSQPAPVNPFAWGDDAQAAPPPVPLTVLTTADSNNDASSSVSPSTLPPPRPTPPRPSPPRPSPPARPPPASPARRPDQEKKPDEPEEDAWTRFNKMTAKVTSAVSSTSKTLDALKDSSVATAIHDESYIQQIGGSQAYIQETGHRQMMAAAEAKQNEKLLRKKLKAQGRKAEEEFSFDKDEEMDRKAQELARKMAEMRPDLQGWSAPPGPVPESPRRVDVLRKESAKDTVASAISPPKKRSLAETAAADSSSLELPPDSAATAAARGSHASVEPIGDLPPSDPELVAAKWRPLDEHTLQHSESDFFGTAAATGGVGHHGGADPFAPQTTIGEETADDGDDPFAVRPIDELVAEARAALLASHTTDDTTSLRVPASATGMSTPTQGADSPRKTRSTGGGGGAGFDDDFEGDDEDDDEPLYDEDDSTPLAPFTDPETVANYQQQGWPLMVRWPLRKKLMGDRVWKPVLVRIDGGNMLRVYEEPTQKQPQPKLLQEVLLQATYSLSDTVLQAYDVYGKIHTVRLQHVQYREKVGIRPGQVSRLMEGHVTKYGLPLEHAAQCQVLVKLASLSASVLASFVSSIEDILFHCHVVRGADVNPTYKQDEVQVHCYDEYRATVDKFGVVSDERARVRMFCLAFVSGKQPKLEIGLNDRRREGKEVVRRKDIMPMYTERWIRFEGLEFHNTVDKKTWDEDQLVRLAPPDGCLFEVLRFRVRPPRSREQPLSVRARMRIAGSRVEIRVQAVAAANLQRTGKGAGTGCRQIPCEDIQIRFPIPEAWIYLFREERHWGVGSVHAKKARPGKVKNLKERLLGATQTAAPSDQQQQHLLECAIGDAKYEHVHRALVWRIGKLPEKHHEPYKEHLLLARFTLSSFDLMPDEFTPNVEVEYTQPLGTVSNAVVRSMAIEEHEDSERVEKFVRYVAKRHYEVAVDYVQCAQLDAEAVVDVATGNVADANEDATGPAEAHKPAFDPTAVDAIHDSYRIGFTEEQLWSQREQRRAAAGSSSSDEDDKEGASRRMPVIKIDMQNYAY